MKFVNLKTCDGIESYLLLPDGLLPLKLLPERLRQVSQRELIAILDILKQAGERELAAAK